MPQYCLQSNFNFEIMDVQVGKLLSELLRDGGSQAGRQGSAGGEQGRWQAELSRVALELIAVSTVFAVHFLLLVYSLRHPM